MKRYISVSQVNAYLTCPAAYRFRYVDKVPSWTPSPIVRGRAVHEALEHYFRAKLDGKEPSVKESLDRMAGSLNRIVTQESDVRWSDGESYDEAIETDGALLEAYLTKVAPEIQPAAMEQRFEMEFEGRDYVLIGYLDLVTVDGWIRDFKTTKRTPSDDVAEKSPQLSCYALGYRHLYGMPPAGLQLDYAIKLKAGPKLASFPTQRSEQQINRFLATMDRVVDTIAGGHFYPNEGSWTCSAAACPHWKHCHTVY